MTHKLDASVLALAGIAQAIGLMSDFSKTGQYNQIAFIASVSSILKTDPENALSVYGDWAGIQYGLAKLLWLFTPPTKRNETRVMLSIMRLQKKIFHSQLIIERLTERINQVKKQTNYFNIDHPSIIANLADIYENILRSMRFNTSIRGNPRVLNVPANMEKIRIMLLAAVRSSVLWRQMGGSKWDLIFHRKKIQQITREMLQHIPSNITPIKES